MLSVEWIPRLISLDLMWFVELIMGNLLWAFMFFAIVFVYNEKFTWKFLIILVLGIFGYLEFLAGVNLVVLVAGFLFVYYTLEVVLLNFTETVPSLKGKIPLVLTAYAAVMIVLFKMNVFG